MSAEARFITKHEVHWKALEQITAHVQKKGIKRLSKDEVREFARLFRLASHHMAYAKTHFPHGQILPYLNRLVGTAHNYFYVREAGAAADIKGYFTRVFPQTVRETWRYSAAATGLFFLGLFFAAFYGVWFDMLGNPQAIANDLGPPEGWDGTFMSAFFVVNNTTVAINAFVWGIFAGIGTVYVLIYNGLIVGALFGFLHTSGADMTMAYSLILPHGVVELAAIFLSGGAGLMIAKGMLIPGIHSRKHSVIMHTRKAVTLLPGIAFLLLIAAVIEGFFTPLAGVSPVMKLVFAGMTGLGLLLWFIPRSVKNEA
ncbi:MAG: stage II sporulation protein M [Defluviitaleaceae bacterium]|nr:stage II sporulation protein M [Defluviitaleaceae bacterium]MCL2274793.1 stage II sporulation protein M [Defluviitaleaceae bacterium]